MNKIKLVIGLGNPGLRFKNTYHNTGKLFLKYLIKLFPPKTVKKSAREKKYTSYQIELRHPQRSKREALHKVVILVEPACYMNESGKALAQALMDFKLTPSDILVVHDDADIMLGKYKISYGRGAAGHRGVLSIMKELGTQNFLRARIGIRSRSGKAGKFVLEKIPLQHKKLLYSAFEGLTEKLK